MNSALKYLVQRLDDPIVESANVIRWGSPVPAFGNHLHARLATLGLNPSNREFVDSTGDELEGELRRFHTLRSLGLATWTDARTNHIQKILESCHVYFSKNPYDRWFKRLDYIISGSGHSFYCDTNPACHFDLIPYATTCKWTELSRRQKIALFEFAGDTLGLLLRESAVKLLILNGNGVVRQFEQVTGVELRKETQDDWSLPRNAAIGVAGFSYSGEIQKVCGVPLDREVLVLGYNHNIQSSFGVTKNVIDAIREWVSAKADEVLS